MKAIAEWFGAIPDGSRVVYERQELRQRHARPIERHVIEWTASRFVGSDSRDICSVSTGGGLMCYDGTDRVGITPDRLVVVVRAPSGSMYVDTYSRATQETAQ